MLARVEHLADLAGRHTWQIKGQIGDRGGHEGSLSGGQDAGRRTKIGPRMQPETRYARSGDLYIAYQVFGDGPVDLVFMPNWFSNVEVLWQHPLAERVLRRLASFSRVILFDQRGSGASDPAPITEMIVLEERASDILAVLDAAGVERAVLLSATMTGPLGCFFAATHGDRTESLILLDASVRRAPEGEHEANVALLESIPASWGTPTFIESAAPGDEPFYEWIAFYRRMSMGPGAAQAMFRAYFELDATHLLAAVHVPTLVLRHETTQVPMEQTQEIADRIDGATLVLIEGISEGWLNKGLEYIDEVERFLRGGVTQRETARILATVLFTDIVGSSERATTLGDARWIEMLDAHARVVAQQTSRFGGRVLSSEGDGSLMTFDGPARAIRCAAEIRDATKAIGLDVRAGLHTGEVEIRAGGNIGGIALHIGARIATLASAGEVLVSSTVKELVVGSGIGFEDRGVRALKGVPDEWRIFAVSG
jgi:class 3 adenylate cyclase